MCAVYCSLLLQRAAEDSKTFLLLLHMLQMCTAAETVKIILEAITGTLKLKSEDEIVVFVNNLGGTSQLEQWLITGEVHKQFSKHLKIFAVLVKCGSSPINECIPQE
jgi:hypothetical protein